ncbi:MAG: TRAM domain-containing protein [Candidatus Woesearchaeota archaeon]
MGFNKFGRNEKGFKGRRFRDNREPPVKEGEEMDATIEAIAEKGDGLTRKDGFVIFVPGTKQGERAHIKITKVLRRVGFAEKIGEAKTKETPKQEQKTQGKKEEAEEETEDFGNYEDTEDFGEDSEEF